MLSCSSFCSSIDEVYEILPTPVLMHISSQHLRAEEIFTHSFLGLCPNVLWELRQWIAATRACI